MFWIAFKDYFKFFYITTICISDGNNVSSRMVCDIPDLDSFGMAKVTVPQDIKTHSAIALD
jgi:hypothetical protein